MREAPGAAAHIAKKSGRSARSTIFCPICRGLPRSGITKRMRRSHRIRFPTVRTASSGGAAKRAILTVQPSKAAAAERAVRIARGVQCWQRKILLLRAVRSLRRSGIRRKMHRFCHLRLQPEATDGFGGNAAAVIRGRPLFLPEPTETAAVRSVQEERSCPDATICKRSFRSLPRSGIPTGTARLQIRSLRIPTAVSGGNAVWVTAILQPLHPAHSANPAAPTAQTAEFSPDSTILPPLRLPLRCNGIHHETAR